MRLMPLRSKAVSSARSVAATPSSKLLSRSSRISSAGTLVNARRRLSATSNRSFAKDLLDVADNLRRALTSVPADDIRDERLRSLLEGVAATERALLTAFERNGIKRIEPQLGDRFDVNQ